MGDVATSLAATATSTERGGRGRRRGYRGGRGAGGRNQADATSSHVETPLQDASSVTGRGPNQVQDADGGQALPSKATQSRNK